MNRKLLATMIGLLIVLVTATIPMIEQETNSVKELPSLSFSKGDTTKVVKKKPQNNSHNYNNRLRDTFKGKTPPAAIKIFWAEFNKVENNEELNTLLSRFTDVCRDSNLVKYETALNTFTKELVKKALLEKDDNKRATLIAYHQRYCRQREYYYYNISQQYRPGEKIAISYNYYRRYKPTTKKYKIDKIQFDKNYQIVGYTNIKSGSLAELDNNSRHGSTTVINSANVGIYRLTIYGDTYIQERMFQVNWLDAMVKRDKEKLLVYASSFKDTVKAPYKVHFISSQKEVKTKTTDAQGKLLLSYTDSTEAPAIIVEKNGNYAFVQSQHMQYSNDTTITSYCYTDRPFYRPGQKVYFQGILHRATPTELLSAGTVEQVTVKVYNPERKVVKTATLQVNSWGHVLDSLELSATAKQGEYSYTIESIQGSSYQLNRNSSGALFTVEAYKKPQFKIEAKATRETYSSKDTVKIKIKGEYFFGGALSDQPLKVRWYNQEIYHYRNHGSSRFHFYPHGQKRLLHQEELTLDKDGTITATIPAGKGLNQHSQYLIAECILTDESRREIRKEVTVKVVEGEGFLFIKPNKYSYNKNDTASFEITAIDLDGEPLQKPVSLRLKHSNALILDTSITTNQDGSCFLKAPLKKTGYYLLDASIKMGDGSYISATSNSIYVNEASVRNYQWEHLEISLDKELYNVGDTATISINCGADKVKALLTVEGEKLHHSPVVKIKENRYSCKVPLKKEMGRSINFTFSYSGSTRFVTSSKQVQLVDSTILLDVNLSGNKELKPGDTFTGKLTITDQQGNPVFANFSVALVDEAIFHLPKPQERNWYYHRYFRYNSQNDLKGVLGILPYNQYGNDKVTSAVSRFDMSLIKSLGGISLQPIKRGGGALGFGAGTGSGFGGGSDSKREELLEKLKEVRSNNSVQKKAAASSVGRFEKAQRSPMAFADKDANEAAIEPPRERSEFKDLGYWKSSITTNKKGEANLSFTMPDDLTKWRLVVIGGDGMSKLIDFRDSMVTKMDVMVKLEGPRVLVEGDSLLMTSVIHNYSGKELKPQMGIRLKKDSTIATFVGKTSTTMTIGKGETERVDWPLIVKRGGELTAYTEALSTSGSDAESRTFPVLVNGISRTESHVGSVGTKKQSARIGLALPDDGRKGSREVTISYSPSMAQTMFESLDYLTGFPYGCVEQTMSRFLPNLYVASTMDRLGLKNDTLLANIPKYTHKGLERLEKFQHSDGGWGWWEGDKTDPRMTALVVYGLTYALNSKHVDKEDKITMKAMLNRAVPMVRNFIEHGQKQVNDEQKVNLLYALRDRKELPSLWKYADSLCQKSDELSVKSQAQLIEICHKLGKNKLRDTLVVKLVARANRGSNGAYWTGSDSYRWYRQHEEATAQAVNALTYIDREGDLVEAAVHWLSKKKRNGYWVSTKTTAAVLNAMSTYLAKSSEFNPDFTITVTLDEKVLKTLKVNKENMGDMAGEIILKEADLNEKSKLKITMDGTGKFFYSVVNRYITNENPIKAKSNGITLTRSYQRLDYSKDSEGNWQVKRVPFDGVCKSGDEIEVTVKMTCDGSYEHVMVEDFFPAGMEVLKKSQDWYNRWCGWWWRGYDNREARDDRMVFFMGWANNGTTTMTYLLRAETPGRFTALPTKAECMYEPEINGNSEAMTVLINN